MAPELNEAGYESSALSEPPSEDEDELEEALPPSRLRQKLTSTLRDPPKKPGSGQRILSPYRTITLSVSSLYGMYSPFNFGVTHLHRNS
jgi:hypothetical protein